MAGVFNLINFCYYEYLENIMILRTVRTLSTVLFTTIFPINRPMYDRYDRYLSSTSISLQWNKLQTVLFHK